MRITVKDIAKYCGVSAGTVDRALNNRPGIKEATKKRILEAAKALHYRPDFTARSLVKGKSMTLGLVLFDLYNRSIAQLLNAVERRAKELGYYVYITLTNKNPVSEKECIEYLVNHKVDGIILFTVNQGKDFEAYLHSLSIPIVTIFNYISESFQHFGINEREAMRMGVQYCLQKGYSSYIYICPPLRKAGLSNIYTQEERFRGFLDALESNNIKELHIIKEHDYISALDKWNIKKARTAIICSCDYYALEVMNYLKSHQLEIPKDVGLMGFDCIDVLKYIQPTLTTIYYPVEPIGIKAVECLVSKMGENLEYIESPNLEYFLVKGESI
ncbi:LacI family DNA-binding transcriptional regulator [Bacillus sp. B1-b2]|uniref:LacI family DNA-binding transcriptional regulator n=1 Tax=Bacillus sp. B1-b2 TaxID=2653201 RepID=UPI0012618006|nr:LacI family DNA-binding transcriptional regulator [Bacillus sp. B1-b2]KAB7668435.1 LacI family transcriptional regulator [Bacillus sp. B1-b2]